MNPTLPFDIMAVILMMLPAETLMGFQCVCRAWRDLIRDPIFIKNHLRNRASKGNNYLLYVPLDRTNDRAFTLLCDETFEQALEIELPFGLLDLSFIIIGSFNGLLCLTDASRFGTTIYLCNPSVKKYKTINPPISDVVGSSYHQRVVNFALGFGYYDETDDYMIIRIATPNDEFVASKIEVYSMIANSWKNIEVDNFPWEITELKSEAVINDSIHWKVGLRGLNEDDVSMILAFHMGEEVFRQIDFPDFGYDGDEFTEHIGLYKGKLAVFAFHLTDLYPWNRDCYLWTMNEYGVVSSWTKLYWIIIDAGVATPIIFTNNDEIIYEDGEFDLNVHHFESGAITYLGVEDQGYLNFVTYNDSLVLLEG